MVSDFFQPIVTFMKQHPSWAGFITFWITMLESLPIVGYLLPGSVVLTGIGLLVGAKLLPLVDVTLWAILGAIVGDGLSYWLGRYYHAGIQNLRIFSRYQGMLEHGKQFFTRHGGKSVFLGRFFGPLRPIIPVIAGMMDMPRKNFLTANIASALIWAPVHLIPGLALASLSTKFTPKEIGTFVAELLLVLTFAWLLSFLIRVLMVRAIFVLNQISRPLWGRLKTHVRWPQILKICAGPNELGDHYQLSVLFGATLFFVLFAAYSVSDYYAGFVTFNDQAVHHFFASVKKPTLDQIARVITFLGNKWFLIGLTLFVFGYCASRKAWYPGFCLLLAVSSTSVIVYTLKIILQITRPELGGFVASATSYPSGHTTLSMVTYSFIAMLARFNMRPDPRWFLYRFLILLLAMIFVSRLYLGAHWLSDVGGSALLATGLILIGLFMLRRQPQQLLTLSPTWILSITGAVMTLGMTGFVLYSFLN